MLKKFLIFLIDFYRICLSPLKPPTCRFYPTCSQYARESFVVHGVFKGMFFSLIRIMKCHPLHSGGYDPVPPLKTTVKRFNNG